MINLVCRTEPNRTKYKMRRERLCDAFRYSSYSDVEINPLKSTHVNWLRLAIQV